MPHLTNTLVEESLIMITLLSSWPTPGYFNDVMPRVTSDSKCVHMSSTRSPHHVSNDQINSFKILGFIANRPVQLKLLVLKKKTNLFLLNRIKCCGVNVWQQCRGSISILMVFASNGESDSFDKWLKRPNHEGLKLFHGDYL